MLISFVGISSCDSEDESVPEPSAPSIDITSPADLTGLRVLVGSPLTFTLSIEAESGLSSVSLNGTSIKNYTGTETTDSFDFDYTALENGIAELIFVVEDALANTTSADAISVEAVGDVGFLIADMAGEQLSLVTENGIGIDDDLDDRLVGTFNVNGSLTDNATFEIVGNQATVSNAADNPDADAALEFQGNAFKIVKKASADSLWNNAGWAHVIFDFRTTLSQEYIEALPQVNADLNGLTTGTKVIQLDAYYDDTQDANIDFSSLTTQTEIWNADPGKGYLIDLTLVKHEVHRENHDGSGMYIGYQGYVDKANEWVTVTFDGLDLGRVGNFSAAGDPGKKPAESNEIDGVRIIPGGGYNDGGSPNAIYFRNLRIVDSE